MTVLLRPRGVVFDMDGLLLNTEALRMAAVEDCARELGVAAKTELFAALIGGATPQSRAALDAHIREELPPDFWTAYRRFADLRMQEVRPMPGAVELLDHLKTRGVVCAMATSATRASVETFCGRTGLLDRFSVIVARGDYAAAKPAPDPYLAAADRLALAPSECLALEDSYNGVRSAVAAGMPTIMAPDVQPATDEMRMLCVAIVGSLSEVVGRIG